MMNPIVTVMFDARETNSPFDNCDGAHRVLSQIEYSGSGTHLADISGEEKLHKIVLHALPTCLHGGILG